LSDTKCLFKDISRSNRKLTRKLNVKWMCVKHCTTRLVVMYSVLWADMNRCSVTE